MTTYVNWSVLTSGLFSVLLFCISVLPYSNACFLALKKRFLTLLTILPISLLLVNCCHGYQLITFLNSNAGGQLVFSIATPDILTNDILTQLFCVLVSILMAIVLILFKLMFTYSKPITQYWLELPSLLLLLLLSLQLFILANDFLLFVISLELITFLTLILFNINFFRDRLPANLSYSNIEQRFLTLEVSLKYFLFNGFSVGLLWLGIVGWYNLLNSITIGETIVYYIFFPYLLAISIEPYIVMQVLFFFAFLLKLGAMPGQGWLPDVYEGVETILTFLLVTVIGPVLFIKFVCYVNLLDVIDAIKPLCLVSGLLSILVSTFGAFKQKRIKRFLAFTSIGHFGFMLLLININLVTSISGLWFYLSFYVIMNIVFFSLLLLIQRYHRHPIIYMTNLRTISFGNTLFGLLILCILFSFAGLPPFIGFLSKLFVLYNFAVTENIGVLLFLIITVFVNIYLYLRIIKNVLFEQTYKVSFIKSNTRHYCFEIKHIGRNTIWPSSSNLMISVYSAVCLIITAALLYFQSFFAVVENTTALLYLIF